jgi:hypothetical protein
LLLISAGAIWQCHPRAASRRRQVLPQRPARGPPRRQIRDSRLTLGSGAEAIVAGPGRGATAFRTKRSRARRGPRDWVPSSIAIVSRARRSPPRSRERRTGRLFAAACSDRAESIVNKRSAAPRPRQASLANASAGRLLPAHSTSAVVLRGVRCGSAPPVRSGAWSGSKVEQRARFRTAERSLLGGGALGLEHGLGWR